MIICVGLVCCGLAGLACDVKLMKQAWFGNVLDVATPARHPQVVRRSTAKSSNLNAKLLKAGIP